VVVDSFSKWPEVIQMRIATSPSTINALNHLFAQFGVPECIVSDNGTQFSSKEFSNFCETVGARHIHTPVYHPQSNGQAERFVDTFKRALQKMQGEGTPSKILDIFLRTYRSTPSQAAPNQKSPAELFLGRRIRIPLDLMLPARGSNIKRHSHQQFKSERGQVGRTFSPGDLIYVLDFKGPKKTWIPAKVIRRVGTVMYQVQSQYSSNIRHVNHIRRRYTHDNEQLPLDILLDTFILPEENTLTTEENEPTPEQRDSAERRHSRRTRPPIQRLNIRPNLKSYVGEPPI
jgi:hypothetical protein